MIWIWHKSAGVPGMVYLLLYVFFFTFTIINEKVLTASDTQTELVSMMETWTKNESYCTLRIIYIIWER